jgi:2-desacetyl-2-hydroxyethyl bacteriochlorophyllide A dehydrogenase
MASTRTLYFTGKSGVYLATHAHPVPSPGEVMVRTTRSGISAGTEMLYYRGMAPALITGAVDAFSGSPSYPMPYGYCVVGVVESVGDSADVDWLGRRVFAFHPHAERFTIQPENLICLPDALADEEAVFLPNMETALGLIHDASPIAGERAIVFGLGVVGLLTGALLGEYIDSTGVDPYPLRRQQAKAFGFRRALPPDGPALHELNIVGDPLGGADLAIEVSGNPTALSQALALTGYAGRIIVGSWYGTRQVDLRLGDRFHRAKQSIVSSQVSAIAPRLLGRWTKQRRFEFALDALQRISPSRLITHRFPLEEAAAAYSLLAEQPGNAIQVIFTYSD